MQTAQQVFQIARYFKDEVFTRTAFMQNREDILANNIPYHNHCMRNYERKYGRKMKNISVIVRIKRFDVM